VHNHKGITCTPECPQHPSALYNQSKRPIIWRTPDNFYNILNDCSYFFNSELIITAMTYYFIFNTLEFKVYFSMYSIHSHFSSNCILKNGGGGTLSPSFPEEPRPSATPRGWGGGQVGRQGPQTHPPSRIKVAFGQGFVIIGIRIREGPLSHGAGSQPAEQGEKRPEGEAGASVQPGRPQPAPEQPRPCSSGASGRYRWSEWTPSPLRPSR
jgi:hypothetical protein